MYSKISPRRLRWFILFVVNVVLLFFVFLGGEGFFVKGVEKGIA